MEATGKRVDILLVDDSPSILRLLMDLLEGHSCDVRVANSGERALAAVHSSRPDLVMLDITMPDIDGYEVCRQLKADPVTADVPVIFVSALDDGMDKVKAFDVGGADYVTKPFQIAEVLARIDHQLEIARLGRELVLQNAELARTVAALERRNDELQRAQQTTDAVFTALTDALPGTVLADRYRLEGKIGAGQYGPVYRATHLGMERPVSVRVLHPSTGTITPEGLARFRAEGLAAYRINHPNAVLMLDFGASSSGIPYLVTEFLEGRTLEEEMDEKHTLTLDRCAKVLVPVCDVLGEAHAAGLVHRDIRSGNVFLHETADGEVVKVRDFGLATLQGGVDSEEEEASVDSRSDIFALGAMAYQMLTGVEPGTAPRRPAEIDPAIAAPVDAVIMQALSPDPARRPSAREFANQFVIALLSANRPG